MGSKSHRVWPRAPLNSRVFKNFMKSYSRMRLKNQEYMQVTLSSVSPRRGCGCSVSLTTISERVVGPSKLHQKTGNPNDQTLPPSAALAALQRAPSCGLFLLQELTILKKSPLQKIKEAVNQWTRNT